MSDAGKTTRQPGRSWWVWWVLAACVFSTSPIYAQRSEADGPEGGAEQETVQAAEPAEPDVVTINEYIVRGNTVLSNKEVEKAVYPYLGPEKTLEDVQTAQQALQELYQSKGYQSVYVELPQQRVTGGVVYLRVVEVIVGRVRVVGAEYQSPLEIRRDVPSLKEGVVPDFELVQKELTQVNRTGSRQVMPVVKEGKIPGTMDVDLRVEDESPWSGSLTLNNDHSADTEELRTIATIGHSNLWQRGHSMSLTLFTAPENTDHAEVWSMSYEAPLSDRWAVRFSGYMSDSNVGTVGGTNVLGKGKSYGVSTTYSLPFDGAWGHGFTMGIDFKDFDETVEFGGARDQVPLQYAPLTFGYNGYYYTEKNQGYLNLSLVTGSDELLAGESSGWREFDYKRYRANPDFALVKFDSGNEMMLGNWMLATKLGLQLASGPLVSNEQFAVGGAGTVRGYLAAEQSGDDGYSASAELRTPSFASWLGGTPWSSLRAHVFAEGGQLKLQDPLPEQEHEFDLASVGVGLRAELWSWLSGGLDVGYPLTAGQNTEKHDPRVHFSITAGF